MAPVAVTCGDPSGVGPEIAWTAWTALGGDPPFFLIGDPDHVLAHSPEAVVAPIETPEQAIAASKSGLPVLSHPFAAQARPGQPSLANAQGVIDVIARGVDLVRSGEASAICTLPISKQVLIQGAGFPHPGHTEYLSVLAGGGPVAMMLACQDLRVVPATIHIPLSDVPRSLTPTTLELAIRLTDAALRRDFGIARPRIAVAGLNPHAGEGGTMGSEENEVIIPVLTILRSEGLDLIGPLSADTMFHAAARAGYDAAVAMYHDQALIPIKTIDFAGGVNVTLGLPFVRTSPDHGTAFDIAGQGRADPTSFIAALRMAIEMAARRADA